MPTAKAVDQAAPKLMFIGKQTEHGPHHDFQEFGEALGFEAAAGGAEIVVSSDNPATLDAAVVRGAARYGQEHGGRVSWRLYTADDNTVRFPRTPAGLRDPIRETFRSPTRWQAAHLAAVRTVDAVIAVGGHDNTHRACVAADAHGRAVWPIPLFAGAAQRVYLSMIAKAQDRQGRELAAMGSDLARPPLKEIARKVIDRVLTMLSRRRPKPRRVYFLSYARADEAAADQVEMFLHRKRRGVIRDEVHFPPGAGLETSMRQGIQGADDMVVLDSENAAKSDSVAYELEVARELSQDGADRRIIGLLLRGMPPRTQLDLGKLHLLARDRAEREQAVDKVTASEPKDRSKSRP